MHRLHCWLFVLILIKHVHRQEAVEQRVPIVWGNGCRADQEDAEWQTNIAYHQRLFQVFVDGSCLLLVIVCGGGDVS